MPFEEGARFRRAGPVEPARGGKDGRQRLETDAEASAFIAPVFSMVGGTAKSGESGGLIVPAPARTIGKSHRAQNPRQVVHCRIRLAIHKQKAAEVGQRPDSRLS